MKTVLIQRAWADDRVTLGMLKILGVSHNPFFTLENPLRATSADSRIPAGKYVCAPYSGTKFKGVYIVRNVPGRSAILFHWGNYERDTKGCILIGQGAGILAGAPAVTGSKVAFQALKSLIGENEFDLEIVNFPAAA